LSVKRIRPFAKGLKPRFKRCHGKPSKEAVSGQ
jgi:hypothetical protein